MNNATTELMRSDLVCPPPDGLAPLIEALRARWGDALEAIVLYGSTRRAANPADGLVDLMALVSDYASAHGRGPSAVFNRLLPPNVYYLEAGSEPTLRCKYMVVDRRSFAARATGGLDGYFWARFSQPCRCVWAREPGIVDWLAREAELEGVTFRYNTLAEDAEILADVYLVMTSGQSSLSLRQENSQAARHHKEARKLDPNRPPLTVLKATEEEMADHRRRLAEIDESSADGCLWLQIEGEAGQSAG